MSDKLFDSFIQKKMQDHVSQVPSDMWDRIMNEKDRNEKVFWYRKWYAVAALLLLMLGSGAAYLYFTEQGTPGNTEVVEQTATTNSNNNSQNQNSILPADQNNADRKNNESAVDKKDELSSVVETNILNENATAKEVNKQTLNAFRFDKEKRNSFYPALQTNNTIAQQKKDNTRLNQEDDYALNNYSQASLMLRENNLGTATLGNYLKTISGRGIPIVACPSEKGERNGAFYLEAFVSPDYNWKKTTGNNSGFLSTKDSAESIQASFTAGFRFAKPIGNHVMFKAGLQYSQINEKFQVRRENERRTVTVITTRTIQTSPGVFTTVSDTSSVEQIGYVTQTSINKYKNIDVPVLLSYEWGNEDIKFAVTGGSIINVHSSSRGQTIDSSGATIAYDKSNNIYKTNMGVGVYGSVSIIKPIGQNADLFAEPYVRYNLSNMTKDGSGFNQKINTAGINLGVRINIGRQRY